LELVLQISIQSRELLAQPRQGVGLGVLGLRRPVSARAVTASIIGLQVLPGDVGLPYLVQEAVSDLLVLLLLQFELVELLRLPHFVLGVAEGVLLEVEGRVLQLTVRVLHALLCCQVLVLVLSRAAERTLVREVDERVVGEPLLGLDLLLQLLSVALVRLSERVTTQLASALDSKAATKVCDLVRLLGVDDAVLVAQRLIIFLLVITVGLVGGDGEVAEVHRALEDGSEESALATILGDVLAGVLVESRVCVLLLPALGVGRLPACPSFICMISLDTL